MNRVRTSKTTAVLCIAIAILVAAASLAGIFLRGDGSTAQGLSIRGESYEYTTTGVYAYNSVRVVAEGVGWDYVTLFLAVPAMLLAAVLISKNSLRGRLLALGLLAYFFYQYIEYASYWAFGPLFLLFILIYALSLLGLVLIGSSFSLAELPSRFTSAGKNRFPFKGMAILCFAMTFIISAMWLRMIAGALSGKIEGVLHGSTTLVVQAYDLGLIVPLMLFTAITALQKKPIAYLLCPVFAVKAVTMASAICAMLLSAWAVEGTLEIIPLAIFGSAALIALWLLVKMFGSVKAES